MSKISRRSLAAFVAAIAFAVAGFAAPHAQAQQKPVIKVSSLTLPVFNPLVWNIMKAKGFDAKNGFELDIHAYPSISAFYAGFATGETDALIGGPTIFQKLYQEGVQLRIIGTGFTLADLVIFAKDQSIKSLADLKGKQLAIDMGGSQFQVVKIYAAAKGIDLGKDITVVNANFGVARAQLEAGRVDAALVIEPLASISAKQHPDWHVIFNGAEGWKEITGEAGWEIVPAMRTDAIQRVPDAPKMLLAALAGRGQLHAIEHGRRRQDRQRNAEAAARHFHRRGGEQAAANDRETGLGAGHPQVHYRYDGARGEGRVLSEDAGREDHLCPKRVARPMNRSTLNLSRLRSRFRI